MFIGFSSRKMKKAIFYKEWIKTRRYTLLALILSLVFVGYALLQLQRVIGFKGVGHLWEILLSRDTVFIEVLTYVPLAIGVLMAVVQFVPEMQQKRLKLTLHLPYPQRRMVTLMLGSGLVQVLGIFLLNYAVLWIYLQSILAPELVSRILLTALPWYLCGLTGYLLAAWICLEPTWYRRIVNLLIAAGVIHIFYLGTTPEAYNCFLIGLALYVVVIVLLPQLSVVRFKQGCQD
jgi:uncharacterized membrane protein YuzA (DUF378 family)